MAILHIYSHSTSPTSPTNPTWLLSRPPVFGLKYKLSPQSIIHSMTDSTSLWLWLDTIWRLPVLPHPTEDQTSLMLSSGWMISLLLALDAKSTSLTLTYPARNLPKQFYWRASNMIAPTITSMVPLPTSGSTISPSGSLSSVASLPIPSLATLISSTALYHYLRATPLSWGV